VFFREDHSATQKPGGEGYNQSKNSAANAEGDDPVA